MRVNEGLERAKSLSKAMVIGELSAYEGGYKIWKDIVDHLAPPIPDELWVFKSNASAIEDCYFDRETWGTDHSELIRECEQAIMKAAAYLVNTE